MWVLADPYFTFWFRYVYPNRSMLQRGRVQETLQTILADLDDLMGPCFEQVCREWASRYARAPELAEATEIGSYWTRTHDIEIDLVARTKERYTAVGSCKWSAQSDTHDLDRLLELRETVRGAGEASVWLFARGFHPALRRRAARDGVQLVSAEELFA